MPLSKPIGYYQRQDPQYFLDVWPLTSAFLDIALHRRGPEDLPASSFLVAALFPLYLLSGFVTLSIGVDSSGAETLFYLIDACAYVAFFWITLSVFKRSARFRQTVSAVLGTAILLNVGAIPLLAWHDAVTSGEAEPSLPLFGYLALILWQIDINGYVLSRALDQPYMVGVLIVILYVMVSMSVGSALSVI